METITTNREHKDRFFKALFSEPANALSLYNAINHSSYEDAGALEYTTIGDTIYIRMKNDLSFLVENRMNLYEHQSTLSQNLPIRGLLYFARLYDKYIETHELNVYNKKPLSLPTPKYVVLYNGKEDVPDETILKLTDLFEHPAESDIEVTARMLNINAGHNPELMERCATLRGYATFNSKVRDKEQTMPAEEAIRLSVDECIKEGILADYLLGHKSEVFDMLLTEVDEEKIKRMFYRDGKEEGLLQGRKEERYNLLTSLVLDGILSEEQAAERLNISVEDFRKKLTNL